MNKKINKKEGEELQSFLQFRNRGYFIKSKKGKGSYDKAIAAVNHYRENYG